MLWGSSSCSRFFCNVKLHKSEQIRTLAALQKSCTVGKKALNITANNLFHRLIIAVQRSASIESYFAYELTPTPAALFKDNLMRKADNTGLARYLYGSVKSQPMPSLKAYEVSILQARLLSVYHHH